MGLTVSCTTAAVQAYEAAIDPAGPGGEFITAEEAANLKLLIEEGSGVDWGATGATVLSAVAFSLFGVRVTPDAWLASKKKKPGYSGPGDTVPAPSGDSGVA